MANQEQDRIWNGPAGASWVEAQESLDRMFQPFANRIAAAIHDTDARRVLDVGCGTGATTLAAARAVGARGGATGVDLSRPMIALARERAAREASSANFIVSDAQTHDFGAARFDLIVSRFGVMFFDDPQAAFANLRRAALPQAALRVFVFRGPAENPFMIAAERAAAPLLPDLPPRRPGAAGQFALADPGHVQGILEAAGWRRVQIHPVDEQCALPADQLDLYLLRMGPVGLALRDADASTRAAVLAAVRGAFAPFVHGSEVRFIAACWEISAV